jgi:hypothetical protein
MMSVRYDMPEDELNELSRIWAEDSNIDEIEGTHIAD